MKKGLPEGTDAPSGHKNLKFQCPFERERGLVYTNFQSQKDYFKDDFVAVDVSKKEHIAQMQKFTAWKATLGGGSGERAPGEHKKSFFLPSNYTMPYGPHTRGYDYSFLNQYACCRVGGGYFENGVGTEPFNK